MNQSRRIVNADQPTILIYWYGQQTTVLFVNHWTATLAHGVFYFNGCVGSRAPIFFYFNGCVGSRAPILLVVNSCKSKRKPRGRQGEHVLSLLFSRPPRAFFQRWECCFHTEPRPDPVRNAWIGNKRQISRWTPAQRQKCSASVVSHWQRGYTLLETAHLQKHTWSRCMCSAAVRAMKTRLFPWGWRQQWITASWFRPQTSSSDSSSSSNTTSSEAIQTGHDPWRAHRVRSCWGRCAWAAAPAAARTLQWSNASSLCGPSF